MKLFTNEEIAGMMMEGYDRMSEDEKRDFAYKTFAFMANLAHIEVRLTEEETYMVKSIATSGVRWAILGKEKMLSKEEV